jgi:hypothetical protein
MGRTSKQNEVQANLKKVISQGFHVNLKMLPIYMCGSTEPQKRLASRGRGYMCEFYNLPIFKSGMVAIPYEKENMYL